MSTFLELCQDTARECGIPGTGPAAVTGQVGDLADIVRWVVQSYNEIQNMDGGKWRWLRREFTLTTTASDATYAYGDCTDTLAAAAIDRFQSWRLSDRNDPPKIYLSASGVSAQTWMTWLAWEDFKRLYTLGSANTNEGFPAHISVDPQDNIRLGAVPDDVYVVTGDYYRGQQTLAADGDTPEMPAQFHPVIVYRAMAKYAAFQSAPEVLIRAKTEGASLLSQLRRQQGQRIRLGGPLA